MCKFMHMMRCIYIFHFVVWFLGRKEGIGDWLFMPSHGEKMSFSSAMPMRTQGGKVCVCPVLLLIINDSLAFDQPIHGCVHFCNNIE